MLWHRDISWVIHWDWINGWIMGISWNLHNGWMWDSPIVRFQTSLFGTALPYISRACVPGVLAIEQNEIEWTGWSSDVTCRDTKAPSLSREISDVRRANNDLLLGGTQRFTYSYNVTNPKLQQTSKNKPHVFPVFEPWKNWQLSLLPGSGFQPSGCGYLFLPSSCAESCSFCLYLRRPRQIKNHVFDVGSTGWQLRFGESLKIFSDSGCGWKIWSMYSIYIYTYIYPLCSMYGICTNSCPKNHPNVQCEAPQL